MQRETVPYVRFLRMKHPNDFTLMLPTPEINATSLLFFLLSVVQKYIYIGTLLSAVWVENEMCANSRSD